MYMTDPELVGRKSAQSPGSNDVYEILFRAAIFHSSSRSCACSTCAHRSSEVDDDSASLVPFCSLLDTISRSSFICRACSALLVFKSAARFRPASTRERSCTGERSSSSTSSSSAPSPSWLSPIFTHSRSSQLFRWSAMIKIRGRESQP